MRFTSSITGWSSQVFIEVRSNTVWPGKIAGSSGNIGPENDFSATVVSSTGTLKPFAPLLINDTLLRSAEMSMVWVANAICDW